MEKLGLTNIAWPTMITPFTEDGEIDYAALDGLIEWYIENGAGGLFSTCQSSEIFFLSLEERMTITRHVMEKTAGRIPVVASGHVAYGLKDQIVELNRIAACKPYALILISNRLAAPEESDEILLSRLKEVMKNLPEDIRLGFYECPYPYKRLLSSAVIEYLAKSERFFFLKDTSCSLLQIREKLNIIKGSSLNLYNANTATLLESLKLGAAGYSGIMANFQMKLYSWLTKNWKIEPEKAERVQNILTVSSYIELKNYPQNAKAYQNQNAVHMTERCRKVLNFRVSQDDLSELSQVWKLTEELESELGIR